ncbi:MAG: PilZ domain-containing protein [Halobacteriovoraceae bacterium]|nr:PilZ domain-containing protein [Halobacteriovoraceae bacterium]
MRSPLKTQVLYLDDGYVLKADTLNVSEGGVLIENLPHVPDNPDVDLLISIPIYPEFSKLDTKQMMAIDPGHFDQHVLRMEGKIVRSFEGNSDVDKVFISHIGCAFVNPKPVLILSIQNYVMLFARNVKHLLGCFESSKNKDDEVEAIKNMAFCMGYDREQEYNQLRQKVLHDYQSLESL